MHLAKAARTVEIDSVGAAPLRGFFLFCSRIPEKAPRRTVHDSLWLWSHVAGSYNGAYNLPGKSRISPAEAAYYMSIPNIYMIHLKDKPEPPLEQYALAFKPLREVVWGIVAAGGHTNTNEREMVLDLVAHDTKSQV